MTARKAHLLYSLIAGALFTVALFLGAFAGFPKAFAVGFGVGYSFVVITVLAIAIMKKK